MSSRVPLVSNVMTCSHVMVGVKVIIENHSVVLPLLVSLANMELSIYVRHILVGAAQNTMRGITKM